MGLFKYVALKFSVILQFISLIDDLVSKAIYSIKEQRQFLTWTRQTCG